METCTQHEEMTKAFTRMAISLARIEECIISMRNEGQRTIREMEKHIEQGEGWRKAIIGIIFAGIVQVVVFGMMWGKLSNQVEINTHRWDILMEENHKIR